MGHLQAEQLRQKILRFVAVAILLTGILVSGMAVTQLYSETRRHTELLTSVNLLHQAQRVDQRLQRLGEARSGDTRLDTAMQRGLRTELQSAAFVIPDAHQYLLHLPSGDHLELSVETSSSLPLTSLLARFSTEQPAHQFTEQGQWVFFQPLPLHHSWALITLIPARQVALPAYRVLASALLVILFVLMAGMLLATRAIRPLLQQMDLSEKRLRHLTEYDQLTGLPNWSQLHSRLGERLAQAAQDPTQQLAVLFINLNRFKVINESLGHEAGNQALRQVAERLQQLLPAGDLLARATGDEFLMCVQICEGQPEIEPLVQRILISLKQPLVIQQKTVYLDATIGISLFPDHAPEAETLLQHADAAQMRARQSGQGRYQFYEADMSARSLDRFELETDLRAAMQRQEFELFYQPQIDLQTGEVSGAEALIRWNHPTRGRVPPDQFIPIAEETGLIHPIGQWVLEEACRQACLWQEEGHELKVSVNLSALQLNNGDIVDVVRQVLQQTGLSSRWLELELTESYLFENFSRSARVLKRLRLLGVSLALDDFGTGYSSLSYLRRLTLHRLKIDRSFVKGLPDDPGDLAIVNTIIAMAKSLSLEVVAEGVETAQQHQSLLALGCHTSQGYYYAAPESAQAFRHRLATFRRAEQY
ncbi:diguanylate cyclase/phosphodiesterase (GGDEF & EAL domains) with PAS/PAC sensor(s) [Nitrincola lacisaponensis]|uniref:cyclic-guanylate-specific phosphodiesterase n=1 Tax=Nitrincola lacisaponensis TaxID=267850 RepID=A0A063Y737_9GAMM|nr:EAL domain-containing protein [Nitrincola lacisaponensis]KDE40252.1 diguanylate cyclase/phosphodiesterase (GGDEF & EAL domains) with PAS/PAC sensor(s) [Nitrincola lacisaponensis]